MIFQNISANNEKIRKYGCYLVSFANAVIYFKKQEVFINAIYDKGLKEGVFNADCYIDKPEKLGKLFDLNISFVGKKDKDYKTKSNEFEILAFYNPNTDFTHFVLGDGNGKVLFDSLGKSITVRDGYLDSKRIFRFD